MLNVHGSMPFGLTLLQDLESLEDKILKYKSMAMHMVKQKSQASCGTSIRKLMGFANHNRRRRDWEDTGPGGQESDVFV